jgi:hypothetical protein
MKGFKLCHAWILSALALYFFFSLVYIELPGLHYDEVNFANAALGDVDGSFIAWKVRLFGNDIPLMIMDYIGALKSALYAPIFRIFGTGPRTVRLPAVGIGAITLLFAYALLKRMFDARVALAGLFLFATDPSFIFANRLDWGPVSLMLALELSSLYCLRRWMSEGNRFHLAASGFLLGIGVYNKIIFLWYVAALWICVPLFFRNEFRQLLNRRNLACFLSPFLLGCLPLIAFNIAVPGGTFRNEKALTRPSAESLRHRYALFRSTLDGRAVYYFLNQQDLADTAGAGETPGSGKMDRFIDRLAGFRWIRRTLTPYAFAGSALWILAAWCAGRLRWKREILFVMIQTILIAGFICLSPKATGSHHVLLLYPFLFAAIAYAVCELGRWQARAGTGGRIAVAACAAVLLWPQLVIDARYLGSFVKKGGVGVWSDAIYELWSFAQANPDRNLVLMDWGFNTQLTLLSAGRARKEEFVCESRNLEDCLESLMTPTTSYLVFHAPPFESVPVYDAYKRVLARRRLRNRAVKTFYQRDGRPVYMVCAIAPPSETDAPPGEGFSLMRQGEDWDARSGGGLDLKAGASNSKALGSFWGRRSGDFASYRFALPRRVSDARLCLRYAFEGRESYSFSLVIDGSLADVLTIPPTGGFGYTRDQWKIVETGLGDLVQGEHELRLVSARDGQTLNLDYWCLREGRSELLREPLP